MVEQSDTSLVYVGTYSRRGSKGIYAYALDLSSGALEASGEAAETENPSFLVVDPTRRRLYAANEVGSFRGSPGGAVSAFAIDGETGALTYLNQQASHGGAPCHLSIDHAGRHVLVANYSGGNVAVLPIRQDGSLGAATDIVQHHGSSVHPRRQERPHAHSITIDPTNRYALAADLGTDKIMVYQLDLAAGKLVPHEAPWVQVSAGAGPRHLAFHPSRQYVYAINELNSTVTAFRYDETRATLQELQTVSTLPPGFAGQNTCADIHVAPSGRFVYGSNRGHDSIVILEVDHRTGQLECVGHQSTEGKTPRSFALDPSGSVLLAANQDTDTVVSFRVNPQTGQLAPTGHVTRVPAPVCVKIVSFA